MPFYLPLVCSGHSFGFNSSADFQQDCKAAQHQSSWRYFRCKPGIWEGLRQWPWAVCGNRGSCGLSSKSHTVSHGHPASLLRGLLSIEQNVKSPAVTQVRDQLRGFVNCLYSSICNLSWILYFFKSMHRYFDQDNKRSHFHWRLLKLIHSCHLPFFSCNQLTCWTVQHSSSANWKNYCQERQGWRWVQETAHLHQRFS